MSVIISLADLMFGDTSFEVSILTIHLDAADGKSGMFSAARASRYSSGKWEFDLLFIGGILRWRREE